MGERTFTLATDVPVPPDLALDFLADLPRPGAGELVTQVRLSSGVRLESDTVATGTARGTRLVETTTVSAPWPLLGYVARTPRPGSGAIRLRLRHPAARLGP